MKWKNKFVNKVTQTIKEIMFSLVIYAVLVAAVFLYAAISMIKLWMLPASAVAFTIISAYAACGDRKVFNSYTKAFNHRLVELVTWYSELGMR